MNHYDFRIVVFNMRIVMAATRRGDVLTSPLHNRVRLRHQHLPLRHHAFGNGDQDRAMKPDLETSVQRDISVATNVST